MDDNKRKLYNALSADYDMGSFEQFSKDIQDSAKRQKLYDAIKEEYDLPDFDGFSKQLGVTRQSQPQQTPAAAVQQQKPAVAQQAPVQQSAYNPMANLPQGFGELDVNQANQMALGNGPVSWNQPQTISPQTGKPVEKQDNAVKQLNKAVRGDKKAAKESGVDTAAQRMKDEIDYARETGKALGEDRVYTAPWEAPVVSRNDEGQMLYHHGQLTTGITTDDQRAAQYQQQQRDVRRRVTQDLIGRAVDSLQSEMEENAKQSTIPTGDMAIGDKYQAMMNRNELYRRYWNADSPETLLKMLNEKYGYESPDDIAAKDEELRSQGKSTVLAHWDDGKKQKDFANRFLEENRDAVEQAAADLGMTVDDYVLDELIPNLAGDIAQRFGQNMSEKYSVKNTADYLAREMSNSIIGTLSTMSATTKMRRQYMQEELQKSNEGKGAHYNASVGSRLAGETLMFAADALPIMVGGAAGGYTAKAVGSGLKMLGATELGAMVASGSPFLAANVGRFAKYAGLGISGALRLAPFMGTSSAVQEASVGDGTLSSIGESFLEGYWEGAKFGGALGVLGAATGELGANLSSRSSKIAFTGASWLAENQIIAGLDYIKDPENFNWRESSEDAIYMMLASKLSSPQHIKETAARFVNMFKEGKPNQPIRLNDIDRAYIQQAFGGMDFIDIASDVNNIGKILNDKQAIPWTTRQKVSGYTTNSFESSRPFTESVMVMGNQIDERGKNHELIETHVFENEDQKQEILTAIQDRIDYAQFMNDFAVLNIRGMRVVPTEQEISAAQNAFLAQHPETNPDDLKPGGKSYNAIYDLAKRNINEARNIILQFAEKYNMTEKEVMDMMRKKPIERVEDESDLMAELGAMLHEAAYPEGELHTEQSRIDGVRMTGNSSVMDPQISADLAQQVNQASADLNAFYESHPTVKEGVDQFVLSNINARPDEIIMYVEQNFSGSDRDEAIPLLCRYYNLLARRDGYINQIGDNIESYVMSEAERLGFKGMIDDAPDTENIITITKDGKRYTLLNGNVGTRIVPVAEGVESRTVDPEKSGDMIIAIDENGEFASFKPDALMEIAELKPKQQFIDEKRELLQVSDTNTALETGLVEQPKPEEEKKAVEETNGVMDNAGGEAGATTGTGANEPSATASNVAQFVAENDIIPIFPFGKQTGSLNIDGGVEAKRVAKSMLQMFKTASNWQELHDLMYQKGWGSAVNNLTHIKNFFEAYKRNEISDTEVEALFDRSVKPEGEPMQDSPTTAISKIPTLKDGDGKDVLDEEGDPQYQWEQAPLEDTLAALGEINHGDPKRVADTVDAMIKASEKDVKAAEKLKPKSNDPIKISREQDQIDAQKATAQAKVDYWTQAKKELEKVNKPETNLNISPVENNEPENVVTLQPKVASEEQEGEKKPSMKLRLKQLAERYKKKYGDYFNEEIDVPGDAIELVALNVGTGRQFRWEDKPNGAGGVIRGFKTALGINTEFGGRRGSEGHAFAHLFKGKDDPSGLGFDEFVDKVWRSDENTIHGLDGNDTKRFTEQQIGDAIFDLFMSAENGKDITEYVLRNRVEKAKKGWEAEQESLKELAEQNEKIEYTDEEIEKINRGLPFEKSIDEEIPDASITKLAKEAESLMQEEGAPSIVVYDTDRISGKGWRKLAEKAYDGAFLSDEDVEAFKQEVLDGGVFYDPESGKVTVFSGELTPEELRNRVEHLKERIKDGLIEVEEVPVGVLGEGHDETRGRGKNPEAVDDRQGEGSPESERTESSERDEYLKPRNEKEQQIIDEVNKKLQSEIEEAIKERDKAASNLEIAKAKESERATDIFSDDEAFNQEGQLFGFDEMPTDRSQEGVTKRTSEEYEALAEAQQKLNKLQSIEERNSRIRGALDNERRQTSIDGIDERQKEEYDKYIKPLLDKSDEELQQLKKAKEDAVGGDMLKLAEDKEYSGIVNVLTQREVDRTEQNKGKVRVEKNDNGETEYTTKRGNQAYIVAEYNKNNLILLDRNLILTGEETREGAGKLQEELNKLGEWKQGINRPGRNENQSGWIIPKDKADELDRILREHLEKLPNEKEARYNPNPIEAIEEAAKEFRKEQDEAIGATRNETPEQVSETEGDVIINDEPLLTEEEINNSSLSPAQKTWAKAYLKGLRDNELYTEAYLEAYEDVRNRRQDNETDRSDADGTQLAGSNDREERESGKPGEQTGELASGGDVPRQDEGQPESGGVQRVENGKGNLPGTDGERGDNGVSKSEPGLDGVPTRGGDLFGGSGTGGNGRDVRREANGQPSSGVAGQTGERDVKAKRQDLKNKRDELLARLKELKEQEKKDDQGKLQMAILPPAPSGISSYIPKDKEQRKVFWELATTTAEYGYTYLEEGITKFKEWKDKVYEEFVEPIKDFFGWGQNEVDRYIEQVWNSDYEINGMTRTMAEWASMLEPKKLREVVAADRNTKFEQQKAAENIEVKTGDIDNIRETLPYLLPEQQDDVLKAETQFFDESHQDREHGNGKGMMFTNGTGTGKTYTGLGIVKRFVKQGKGRVLILTPSQEKVTDWRNDGRNLGLDIESLDEDAKNLGVSATKAKGKGVVVTTYANARQNLAMLEDCFDLIVYDESHKIMESKEATNTTMMDFHEMLTNKNVEKSMDRQTYWLPEWIEYRNLLKERDENREKLDILDQYADDETIKVEGEDVVAGELKSKLNARMMEIEKRFEELRPIMQEIRESKRPQAEIDSKRTKTVFLSATPFNVRESLRYAEGYLFSFPEEDPNTKGTYNHRSPEDAFLEQMFPAGYRWRYGRLESHVANAEALGRQEIDFSDYLQNTLGTMSGRMIASDYDYSRDFPVLTLNNAGRFNQAMSEVYRNKRYQPLAEIMKKVWNYNDATSLFEAMKTSLVNDRIREHLARGQKVVVFHRRRTSRDIALPFHRAMELARIAASNEQDGNTKQKLLQAAHDFEEDFKDIFDWEETIDYTLPREQIERRFGKDNVAFFSGAETKKTKHQSVEEFMKDNGGKDIIVIQEASGKEGISLHDQTGEHQRVEINLALPQSPIAFIQIEGRIYRIGQKSNAIFEYPLLGLDLETNLFAQKFNNALGTTENLALGSKARNLRKSIQESVLTNTGEVDYDRQGLGGKDLDGRVSDTGDKDGFDMAIQDYYGNQKMKRGRDNREGIDYFPTPEPIGYKMVEFAQMLDGDTALEPSAGHGAIARYVPETNGMTAVEPSASLFTKLQMRAGGPGRRFEEMTFEDYPLTNKHDVILMNPPYGVGGKTAMEHVAKAFRHLNEGGRIVAIIPDGPAMEKRLDAWLASRSNGVNFGVDGAAVVVGEVKLPDVAFGRAGTNVRTRIVVIDKVSRAEMRKNVPQKQMVDLSSEESIGGLFDRIRDVRMPERTIDQVAINTKKALKTKRQLEENPFTNYFVITPDNYLRIRSRERFSVPEIYLNLENPKMENVLSWYQGLKKIMDNPDQLEYGKYKERSFGSGKNKVPAMDAIKDYCQQAIKTLENVTGVTADQMDKMIRDAETERERRRQEQEEEWKRDRERREQDRLERFRQARETLLQEIGDADGKEWIEAQMEDAWSSSTFLAAPARRRLTNMGIDWETGQRIKKDVRFMVDNLERDFSGDSNLDYYKSLIDKAHNGNMQEAQDAREILNKNGIDWNTGRSMNERVNARTSTVVQPQTTQRKADYEYKLDKNTRTGEDMHLVNYNGARLSDNDYKTIERKAKSLGGYYNRFKKAFHFKTEEEAKKFADSLNGTTQEPGTTTRFRLREKEAPKKTQKVYKLMRLGDDGKLYPLFIDSANPYELGKWYDADSPDMSMLKTMPEGTFLVDYANGTYKTLEDYAKEKGVKVGKNPSAAMINEATANGQRFVRISATEKGQRRYDGENRKYMNIGINGSGQVGEFAMRPGWHAGSLPSMRQIGKGKDRNLRDDNFVWVEGEISADKDYQGEADMNPDKDIPTHIPEDGFYLKATNANKSASQADRIGWYVAGSFKPNRIMSDREARNAIDEWNREHPDQKVEYDFDRESGREFNADTMRLEEPVITRFSRRSRNKKTPETNVVPGEKTPFKATGFSSVDGAKVRKDLETLAKKSENLSLRYKNSFILDLAETMKAVPMNSGSRYAKYETKNGDNVLFRFADHNATVSNFDNNGEKNGISIVISRKDNEGLENDGNAHVVEFYYSDKDLKKADGNPYAEIVKSIHQALYSGEYKDTTGLAKREEANGTLEDAETRLRSRDSQQNPIEADFRRKEEAGRKLAKKLNADFEAVTDISQIKNQDVLNDIAAGNEVPGWIEIDKNGNKKIFMFLPHVRDTYDAEKTIAHEAIGHMGFRELLGEKGYKDYMLSLVFDLKNEELSKYIDEHLPTNGFDLYRTVDEFLAEAAEKGYGDISMWQKVKESVTNALRSVGFTMSPSISDVKYMVWLSKHNLEKGNVMSKVERDAILYKLGKESYEANVNNGEFGYGKEIDGESNPPYFPGEGETYFRSTPSAKNQKRNYERALSRYGYVWKEAHVDQMQAAVELMRAISGIKKIEDIPAAENFVLLENQMSSKEEQMDYLLNRDLMEPLDEAIAKCLPDMGKGVDEQLRNIQLYMIKKHGLERNRVLFVRDAIRALRKDSSADQQQVSDMEQDYYDTMRDLRDQLRNGYIDLKEYFEEVDKWISHNLPEYKVGEKDYSGLTAMYGKGYNEADIVDEVMGIESMLGKDRVDDLWDKTNALSKFGLDTEYEGGLDSKDKHDKVSQMFEWYVPLRGYDEKTAEEVYDYLEENDSNDRKWAGPVLMNAKGHEYLSDVDVFATLGAMSSNAINRSLRNQMKQAFARFIRNNYNKVEADERLVTELPYLWAEKQYDSAGNEIWVEKFPDIPENAKADDIAAILDQYQQDMKAKEGTGDAKRIRQNSSIPFRPASVEHRSQHIVDVWINGEKHAFIVNGNPRAAQAINGQLKAERRGNFAYMSDIAHTIAKLATSYNPDFIISNAERDAVFSASAIGIKESPKYLAHWIANYAGRGLGRVAAGVPIWKTNLFNRYRNNELDMSNPTDRYFKEFMENGGETGWVESKNIDKWKKLVKDNVNTIRSKVTKEDWESLKNGKLTASDIGRKLAQGGKDIFNLLPHAIEVMNERAENMARFTTYMTSRQMGRSITRSVSDAKEVSVNFNRKGAGYKTRNMNKGGNALQQMNALVAARTAQYGQDYIMFYNAGVQGLNNASKLFRDHPIKASTLFTGFALGAFIMSWINQGLIDSEDESERGGIKNPYAELPEYIRRNNACLYVGNGNFLYCALPIELRAMYGIGDMAAGYTEYPDLKSDKPIWQDVMTQLTQVLPIDFMGEHPGNPIINFMPSSARPIAEILTNQNWYGRPIEKESYGNDAKPRHTRAYRSVNKAYMGLAKKWNATSNDYSEDKLRRLGVNEEAISDADSNLKGLDGWLTDPSIAQHIVESYFGGLGKTAGNLAHVYRMINEDDATLGEVVSSDKTPILRKFHYSPTEQNKQARTRNKWFYYKDQLQDFNTQMNTLKEYGVKDPVSKLKEISIEDSVKATQMKMMADSVKAYNRQKKIYDNPKSDESRKEAARMRMEQIMQNTVMAVDSIQ